MDERYLFLIKTPGPILKIYYTYMNVPIKT